LPSELTLFGRAALALGYSSSHTYFHSTQDVDGILPLAWLELPDRHEDFSRCQLESAFAAARVPEVPEIRDIFVLACPKVIALVSH